MCSYMKTTNHQMRGSVDSSQVECKHLALLFSGIPVDSIEIEVDNLIQIPWTGFVDWFIYV